MCMNFTTWLRICVSLKLETSSAGKIDFDVVSVCVCADGSDIPVSVEQQRGTLHFTKVTRADAGNYTCLASNDQQGEIRAVVQLTVAGTAETQLHSNTRASCG